MTTLGGLYYGPGQPSMATGPAFGSGFASSRRSLSMVLAACPERYRSAAGSQARLTNVSNSHVASGSASEPRVRPGLRRGAAHIASACLVTVVLASSACSASRDAAKERITPEYDKDGKLQLLKYDSKGGGKIDTWSYMDGARVVRIEIDKNGDGKIDSWEYYGPDQQLERIGSSRLNDGRMDRLEYYDHDVLVRAEEDADADGKMDKWETYDAARLTSVAFDTLHRGVPDRRLTYGSTGTASLEVDLDGDGHLLPGAAGPSASRRASSRPPP
jgi:hypothetical protein